MTVSKLLFAVRQTCLPALSVCAVLSAGFSPAVADAAKLPDKTLVFCSEGSPAGFDSAQYTTSVEFSAGSYTVYNRLIEFAHGSTDIEPGLAEKWYVSPDGQTYTFH
jgi:dipeptide transport system substrate-binding protein